MTGTAQGGRSMAQHSDVVCTCKVPQFGRKVVNVNDF